MLKNIAIAVPLAGLALTGCLGPDPLVGSGAINLSPGVQAGFKQYKEERSPGYFAVSADGRWAHYTYCPDGRCLRGSKSKAVYNCEKQSKGSPCKIYAAYGEVVWGDADEKTDSAQH